jgi:hypothetical protein
MWRRRAFCTWCAAAAIDKPDADAMRALLAALYAMLTGCTIWVLCTHRTARVVFLVGHHVVSVIGVTCDVLSMSCMVFNSNDRDTYSFVW